MLLPGEAVLVCVSGGPDSMALLHLLMDISKDMALFMGVIHLNHGLRGAASDGDADFVRSLVQKMNLPFFERKADVKAFAKSRRLSLEDAARQVRYAYFQEIADAHYYKKIALGHHADDVAELMLMNLMRGGGPQGLSGIPPVRDGRFIRPLIDVSKAQIQIFLDKSGIAYVTDASNQDIRHRRNRIRHHLIPLLQDHYNPDISKTLSRLADVMREENQWLDNLTTPHFHNCRIAETKDRLVFSLAGVKELARPIARRVIRQGILQIKGDLRRIGFAHINAILDLMETPYSGATAERELHLPDKIKIKVDKDRLVIKKVKAPFRRAAVSQKQAKISES